MKRRLPALLACLLLLLPNSVLSAELKVESNSHFPLSTFNFPLFTSLAQVTKPAHSEFTALVERVIDGDTIVVTHRGHSEHIRLYGVDCPEKRGHQPFNAEATALAQQLVLGQDVTVKARGKDIYGRTVAEVITASGKSVSSELAKAGLAWYYRGRARAPEIAKLEAEARAAKLGLWADEHPTAPWVWRKQHHSGK